MKPSEIRYAETASISLGRQSKAGVRVLISICAEAVDMDNMLPARGEILLSYCASQKCKKVEEYARKFMRMSLTCLNGT